MTTDLIVLQDEPDNEISRSVTLSNEEWSILALCADAYATTFRTQQSEFVATFVTRNQLDEAVSQAAKMNALLQKLDRIQAVGLSPIQSLRQRFVRVQHQQHAQFHQMFSSPDSDRRSPSQDNRCDALT